MSIVDNKNYSSDDDESSLDGETSVDIGFVNENEKTRETRLVLHSSTFYPCKLGGKPQWLDYKNLKSLHDDLICSSCSLRLSFLLQIYAPLNQNKKDETNDPAFHRYLYLFICSNSNCSNKTFKTYRTQLPRLNDVYSDEAPPVANTIELTETDDKTLKIKIDLYLANFYKNFFIKNFNKLCNVCGFLSTKMCAKCKFIFYCSETHQKVDWSYYKHKSVCEKYCTAESLDDKGDKHKRLKLILVIYVDFFREII
jgi:hypothetical protein